MPIASRPSVAPTDDWQQLTLLVDTPEQRVYEGLRPVVLFGLSAAERAGQVGVPRRTFYRRVERFDLLGMRSLFDPEPAAVSTTRPGLAPHLRQLVVDAHAEYPAFHLRELATLCYVASGRRLRRGRSRGRSHGRAGSRPLPPGQEPR